MFSLAAGESIMGNGEQLDDSKVAEERDESAPSRLFRLLETEKGDPGEKRSLNPDMLQCLRLKRR